MLALAAAAGVGGRILRGRAAVRGMFFSEMPAVSLTFARMSSLSVVVASVALGHSAVLNEELTVSKLPVIEHALLH